MTSLLLMSDLCDEDNYDMERQILGEIDINNARQQVPTLQNWWGVATSKSPQLAYERVIDASRLAVYQAYTLDGYLYGMYYAKKENGSRRTAARHFLDSFVNVMDRRLRLQPIWWSDKHKKAMFQMALDSSKDFCILDSFDDSAARKKWGYKTANLLRVMGREVYEAMMDEEYEVDTCHDSDSKERKRLNGFGVGRGQPCRNGIYCNKKKCCYAHNPLLQGQTAYGFGKGEGIPCRYGAECKRPECWFAHDLKGLRSTIEQEVETPIVEQQAQGSSYVPDVRLSKTSLLDHLVDSSGGLEQFKELCGLFLLSTDSYDSFRVSTLVDWPDALGVQASEAQRRLKQKADQDGQPMAQCLLGILHGYDNVKVLGKSGIQETASLKLLTSSALAGNTLAMFHLAMAHHGGGDSNAPNACLWWERALERAAIPFASFFFGAAYTAGPGGMPVNYHRAAGLFAHAIDIDAAPKDLRFKSILQKLVGCGDFEELLPVIEEQLRDIESFIAKPHLAPLQNKMQVPSSYAESKDICAVCSRRPREGEKKLQRCSRCLSVSYCNSVCQKGGWPMHRSNCLAKK